jgi:hypothetical protein
MQIPASAIPAMPQFWHDTRAIASNLYSHSDLALLYNNRGVEYADTGNIAAPLLTTIKRSRSIRN